MYRKAPNRTQFGVPSMVHDRPVDASVLNRVRFTRHAVERFGERAALPERYAPGRLEAIMRDLLLQEGRVVAERPGGRAPATTRTGTCRQGSGCYSCAGKVAGMPAAGTW
jgi:hypothetical protein